MRTFFTGIEGAAALPAGRGLDIGCGTEDSAIYLARHGWKVTAVDVAAKALQKAAKSRRRTRSGQLRISRRYPLSSSEIRTGFRLILDSGCLHGMSDDARDRYVNELAVIAAPDARLLILAFTPGGQFGVRGVDRTEIERRFTPHWNLLADADEPDMTVNPAHPARHYLLQR